MLEWGLVRVFERRSDHRTCVLGGSIKRVLDVYGLYTRKQWTQRLILQFMRPNLRRMCQSDSVDNVVYVGESHVGIKVVHFGFAFRVLTVFVEWAAHEAAL